MAPPLLSQISDFFLSAFQSDKAGEEGGAIQYDMKEGVIHVHDERSYDALMRSEKVVVDYSAKWCAPCRVFHLFKLILFSLLITRS